MALTSSGQITLDDMHVEAGGTTQTQSSLNDSAIRGLINKGTGVQMSFNEWYGASGSLYSDTINAWGSYLFSSSPESYIQANTCGYTGVGVWGTGSIPSLTINNVSITIPNIIYTAWSPLPATCQMWFSGNTGNAGWTSHTFDNNTLSSAVTFTRTSATYTNRSYNTCSNYDRFTWNPNSYIINTSGNVCTPMGHDTTSPSSSIGGAGQHLSNVITTWTLN